MGKTILTVIIAVVVAGGGGFYGGMQYQKSQPAIGFPGGNLSSLSASDRQGLFAQGGVPRGGNFAVQNGFSMGEVVSMEEGSLVIQLPGDAGTKIVFYSDSTEVSKQAAGSIADVAVGDSVTVMGERNDDGSVTADTIQLMAKE